MLDQLSPCPFCGATEGNDGPVMRICEKGKHQVWCSGCGASGPENVFFQSDAAPKWNRRTAANPQAINTLETAIRFACNGIRASEEEAAGFRLALAQIRCAAAPQTAPWMPIETAPKDAPEILLYAPARDHKGTPIPERITSGYWCELPSEDSDGDDFWMSNDGGFTEESPPTHWMPLPAPPRLQGQT